MRSAHHPPTAVRQAVTSQNTERAIDLPDRRISVGGWR